VDETKVNTTNCFCFLERNLSKNSLEIWDGDVTNQLPSLQKVDLTINKNWTTPQNVLKLENVQELEGLYLNDRYQSCLILRSREILKKGHVLGLLSTNNGGFTFQSGCLEKIFTLNSSYNFLATKNVFPACSLEAR